MEATMTHTYEFENRSNAYFQGSDVHVTRDDGRTIVINGKDNMCAVRVKRYGFDIPEEVKDIAADLNRANANRMRGHEWLEDWTELLFEQQREQWWEDAKELAEQAGFNTVWSSGRSGGWCCIDGTSSEDWPRLSHPEDEDDREYRERVFGLMFELVENIDHHVEMWVERIREEHAELEREREECLVRGED